MAAEKARLPTIPAEDVVERYVLGLFRACMEEPAKARVMLTAHFKDDPLLLHPKNEGPERFYEASGAFFLWTTEVLGKSLCGGEIVDLQQHSVRIQGRIIIGHRDARRTA